MNSKKRKQAVLLRHGWSIDGIRHRQIATRWKLAGILAGVSLMLTPDTGYQDAGLALTVMCAVTVFVGRNRRV